MEQTDKLVEERKEAVIGFFRKNPQMLVYIALILIVIFSIWIRTLNTDLLRDVTTGEWTLGPDLDPFLFLRWAEYIVENGSIMHIDNMRYVPLGYDTRGEMMLLSYLIAWFHKILLTFGLTSSVAQSAVYFPAIMFGLTVITFFLFAKSICENSLGKNKAGIVALIASFFLTVIPSLLPRTIAGIPEKESVGFFFMFLALYLFSEGWKSEKLKGKLIWGALAGAATAGMALVWGGYGYIVLTISIAVLISFFLGQINRGRLILLFAWIIPAYILMNLFSLRYSFEVLIFSSGTLIPLVVIGIACADYAIFNTSLKKYLDRPLLAKIPRPVLTLIIFSILGAVISTILFGFSFVPDKIKDITSPLITPVTSRLGVTVAENRQPFFGEWAREFGPVIPGFQSAPMYFWLFFAGAIYLYYHMLNMFEKKERAVMTAGFAFFLFAIIFSRYSPASVFNGTNTRSIIFYILGMVVLLATFGYYYYRYYFNEREKLKLIDVGLILLFSLFFLSIVSARGSVRTIMVLVPSVSIIVPYMLVKFASKVTGEMKK